MPNLENAPSESRRRPPSTALLLAVLLATLHAGCQGPPPPGFEEITIPAFKKPVPLALFSENGEVIRSLDETRITEALTALNGTDNRFAILSTGRDSGSYLEATFDPETGTYEIEYQVESSERRFQALYPELRLEKLTEIFTAYAREDESWARCCSWQKMQLR